MTSARDEILGKIKAALSSSVSQPYSDQKGIDAIYKPAQHPYPEIQFAEELIKLKGEFVYCENWSYFTENLQRIVEREKIEYFTVFHPNLIDIINQAGIPNMKVSRDLSKSKAGIITVETLIARTGTCVLSTRNMNGRRLSIYPEICIVVASVDQVVYDFADAFAILEQKYGTDYPSMVSFMTGPSRTADIEKTLVLGAHGPKQVIVILVDSL